MSDSLIIVNVDYGETRVALIEDGMIVELLLERRSERTLFGNVYRGKVMRVLPAMQAAFVDVGLDRHAFLHVRDIIDDDDDLDDGETPEPPKGKKRKTKGRKGGSRRRPSIKDQLSAGDAIVAQISKEAISTKGPRVTTRVSLPGRHLVYMPTADRGGVSRRISDDKERRRLSKILKRVAPDKGALIARTAAEGASADALEADAGYLADLWDQIQRGFKGRKKPGLLHEELDLPLRVVRDRLNDSVAELFVDDQSCFDRIRNFIDRLSPQRLDSIKLYQEEEPIFDAFGIEGEIRRALARRVELPSGGSLIIDQAEALTAIDVNAGKAVGKGGKDQEETNLTTNLEAVDEIAYQLRFRNIGGLIVLDLIDMDRPASRRKVQARLKEQFADDRARTQVMRISEFGLVEMTRERTRESLGRTLHEHCHYCDGTGHTLSRETVANEILRELRRSHGDYRTDIEVKLHPLVAEVFKGEGAVPLKALARRIGKRISLAPDDSQHMEQFSLRARLRGKAGGEAR